MYKIELSILEYLNKIKRTFAPILHRNEQSIDLEDARIGYSFIQEEIKSILMKNDSLFLARFGSIELNAFCNYLQTMELLPNKFTRLDYIFDKCWSNWWSRGAKNGMKNNAGFFPCDDIELNRWGELCLKDCNCLDVLLSWQKNECFVKPFLRNLKMEIDNYQIYYPILHENPWTEVLYGKKILVISPFSDTIEQQYKIREKLFANKRVLPHFELKVIKAFNFLRGVTGGNIKSWFEALEIMEGRITDVDFDVALLGCGAYAFNLGAFIKRMGKIAITMCGGLPALFGIYGNRNELWLRKYGVINDYWTRPSENERPYGYNFVENGAYW